MKMRLPLLFGLLAGTPVSAQVLYFADIFAPTAADGAIQRMDTSGFNLVPILDTGGGLRSVAVDAAHLYWCDDNALTISRANLDGSNPQAIISSGLQSPVAVAVNAGQLYWGDQVSEEIWRANVDGSNPQIVVPSTPFHRGLAIDAVHGKVYWTTSRTPTAGDVRRCNLDGSNVETAFNGGTGIKPASLALDPQRNRMYFTDYVTKTLRRADLNGGGLTTLFTDQFGNAPRGVTVDPANGDVYWGHDVSDEPVSGEVLRAVGGEAFFEPVASGLGEVFSITISTPAGPAPCYPNCDQSTTPPILNVNDFSCFLNKFAAGDTYANCDGSTNPPVLNVNDFGCFLNRFATGCR